MKAHGFWTLSLVAVLAACTSDNPTGLAHVETIDGVVINRVDDLRMFKLQRLLVADEDLTCETIDFDSYAHGDTLSGFDLAPPPFGVAVGVTVPDFDNVLATGDARIYDTDLDGGEDLDLEIAGQSASLGNVLIQQATATTEPNDAASAGTIRFTFPTDDWVVKSYTALDQEGSTVGEFIELDADGSNVGITDVTANNADAIEVVVIDPNAAFNSTLDFNFNGSGAIDDIVVCQMVERGGEGCTPGFWKQTQHFDSWPGPGDTTIKFDAAFVDACVFDADLQKPESGKLCDLTLLEALNLKGGGANALGRHAAAAWLNTQSIDFYYSQSEVETMVAAALEFGDYEPTKDALAGANEAGCTLS